MLKKLVCIATAGTLSVTAVATTSGALAQEAALAPSQTMHRGDHDARWRDMMQARRMEKMQALRAVLQLRPDQEGAFQAFEQTMASEHPMGGDRMGWRREDDAAMAAATTPQRLDMRLGRMDQREAKLRQRISATKSFYAALSPQQQKAFDGLMALRERRHGFDGHRGERGAG